MTGACHSTHWARGRLQPEQVNRLSELTHTDIQLITPTGNLESLINRTCISLGCRRKHRYGENMWTPHRCLGQSVLNSISVKRLHHQAGQYVWLKKVTHLPFVSTLIIQTLPCPINFLYSITSWFESFRAMASITAHAYIINSQCTITQQWGACPASNFLPVAAGNTINQAPKLL